ncbi:MAG TPA: crotonase/enoyl-CoA hydratase family protein [Aliidongia sp.]|nr:crotonase/enoyl-CoA hydratase family protein [Aliidongia sp.]
MTERVTIELRDGVADVRLNRADKMNAIDDAMFQALVDAGDRLKRERGLRAVVLSGEGRAFCAGLDMGRMGQMTETAPDGKPVWRSLGLRSHGIANRAQYAVWVWREVPVPVIAAVHGVAFGGGFQIMLGADMRYVAPGTKLSIMEIKWGLVPDMAGTQLLRHLVRDDIARELTYTGRIFSPEEALAYGIATRICEDPRQAALEVAREIAGKSPDAIRAAKRLHNAARLIEVQAGLVQEAIEQEALIGSPNQIEAVRANIEQRPPRFTD